MKQKRERKRVTPTTFTHSRCQAFLRCQMLHAWRYEYGIVPMEERIVFGFGSTIHECLDCWHSTRDLELIREFIDTTHSDRGINDRQRSQWHLAHAIMDGYAIKYQEEFFRTVATEMVIEGPVINPTTVRRQSSAHRMKFRGRIDGLVQRHEDIEVGPNGTYWLLEHKTTSSLNGNYMQAIWEDPQIFLYSTYLEQSRGIRIAGVIYNVLAKSRIEQRKEESEVEFEQRRAALLAKSKTGKSSAQRRLGESDEDFRTRLNDIYSPDATTPMFYRQEVLLDDRRRTEAMSELWWTVQSYRAAKRSGHWLKNRQQCHAYNSQCDYWTLCSAEPGEVDDLITTYYRTEDAFVELRKGAGWRELQKQREEKQNEGNIPHSADHTQITAF